MWIGIAIVAAVIGFLLGPIVTQGLSPGTLLGLLVGFLVAVFGFCVWALSNNKSAARASPAQQADAQAMRAPDGKARIYITRRGFVGALQGMNVDLDGIATAQIKSGQMLVADVMPGSHHISVSAAKASLAKPANISLEVGPGQVVVVDAMIEMGALKGTIKLDQLGPDRARENVTATKLMLWEQPPVAVS